MWQNLVQIFKKTVTCIHDPARCVSSNSLTNVRPSLRHARSSRQIRASNEPSRILKFHNHQSRRSPFLGLKTLTKTLTKQTRDCTLHNFKLREDLYEALSTANPYCQVSTLDTRLCRAPIEPILEPCVTSIRCAGPPASPRTGRRSRRPRLTSRRSATASTPGTATRRQTR